MNKYQGFTLIELMVVLVIMGITMTAVLPGLSNVLANSRAVTNANQLVTALNLARSEAIKRGVQVSVCKSADGRTCTTADDWSQGWIVFTDTDADGTLDNDGDAVPCEPADADCLLKTYPALTKGFTLRTGNNFANWVAFNSRGATVAANGLVNDTFSLCDNHTTKATNNRAIVSGVVGRIRTETNKEFKARTGGDITC